MSYRLTPTISAGLEYNPLDDDVGPIANWLAVPEENEWPALMFGTSSDRIGTTHGRAFYGTLSKDLEEWTRLPIAPYVGVSYGTFDDEFVAIAGMMIHWADRWSTTSIWDGHNLHHILETQIGDRHSLGLMLVDLDRHYDIGLTYSIRF